MKVMKKKEVIERLNGCVNNTLHCAECPYVYYVDCRHFLMKNALELLKEQEPIKPTVAADTWICSKCGHRLESQDLIDDKENPHVLVHERYKYCPNCGRAAKWE